MSKDHEDDCPYNYGHNCCCLGNHAKSAQSNKGDTNDIDKLVDEMIGLRKSRYASLNRDNYIADLKKWAAQETNRAVGAEYKQLLNLMPEKQLELMNVESKAAYYNDGWNAYADQCRAIILKRIEGLE